MTEQYDNNWSGVLHYRMDQTWTGSFEIDDTQHHAHLVVEEDRTYLVVARYLKDGKSPAKKPVFKRRIQSLRESNGPRGRIPDPEHPLCIWKHTETGSARYFLQIKPDTLASNIPPANPF